MEKSLVRFLVMVVAIAFCISGTTVHAQDDTLAGLLAVGGISLVSIIWMLWMGFVFLMMLVNIAGMVFWIFMIIDAAKRKYKTENDQLLWILVVVLTGWIGALIYYFMVKRKEDKLNEDNK